MQPLPPDVLSVRPTLMLTPSSRPAFLPLVYISPLMISEIKRMVESSEIVKCVASSRAYPVLLPTLPSLDHVG